MSEEKRAQKRDSFRSRWGFKLACVGSAVGMGNIWLFPARMSRYGGATFLIPYILFVVLIASTGVIGEMAFGRATGGGPIVAFGTAAEQRTGRRTWGEALGLIPVIGSLAMAIGYSVVVGWLLKYAVGSFTGSVMANQGVEGFEAFFGATASAWGNTLWQIAAMAITLAIMVFGIGGGIEKANKVLMPLFFLLFLGLAVYIATLPGAADGYRYMFVLKPRELLDPMVWVYALGQAFFSLSLGTACLCTYASYFSRGINLAKSAAQIALIDTLIAILAGLMIFPAAFSVGIDADSGPSLIFITLPNVFNQAFVHIPWAGYLISILFYALLALAALTSTISMHEIGTSFFQEEMRLPRKKAVWIVSGASGVICILSSMSMGAVEGMTLFGMPLLSFFDFITAKLMMPIGALLTTFYVGWYAPLTTVRNEFTNKGTVSEKLFPLFLFTVRYICPIFILLIFMHELGLF